MMNLWWLVLVVPVSATLGLFCGCLFSAQSVDRDRRALGLLRRGYERRVSLAYALGYRRGFRHATAPLVQQMREMTAEGWSDARSA